MFWRWYDWGTFLSQEAMWVECEDKDAADVPYFTRDGPTVARRRNDVEATCWWTMDRFVWVQQLDFSWRVDWILWSDMVKIFKIDVPWNWISECVKKKMPVLSFFPMNKFDFKKMQITNAQAADGPLTVLVIGCPSVAGVSDDNRLDMHRTWTQLWTITDHNQRNRYFGFRNLKIDVSTMIFRGIFRRWSRLFRVSACPWPHSAGPDDFVDLLEIIDVYAASGSGCDAVDELLRKVRHVCLLEKRIKYKIN